MKRIARHKNREVALIWVALLIILIPFSAFPQQATKVAERENPFVTVVSTDDLNIYISIDLTRLPGFFERAYMLDLIYADSKIVVNKTDISGPALEVFSNKINDTGPILKSIESYRAKAISAGISLSESQKKDLMKKYDKYR